MFVAAIRRLPGGSFAKAPKTPQSMAAIPVQTTITNLASYFGGWPKHRSEFLIYGGRHGFCTGPLVSNGIKMQAQIDKLGNGAANAQLQEGEMRLYGGGSGEQRGPSGSGGQAKKPAGPLGLAGALRRFRKGEKLTMVTAYDFPSGKIGRIAGVEFVLVGDSLGNCRLGLPDTIGVTMEDMLRATTAVHRGVTSPEAGGAPQPIVVGDMPFGSYLLEADALRNAAALRMAGADMVKLEGGRKAVPFVRALAGAGIAVMGHIGLEPQHATLQGGLRMQGTTVAAACSIVEDAKALVEAGAVALVVECVPLEVGCAVQAAVPDTPVIGIGAGNAVAGQVLVCDDLLGLHGQPPSFVKKYAELAEVSAAAYKSFLHEVREGTFPSESHSKRMQPKELEKLRDALPGIALPRPFEGDKGDKCMQSNMRLSQDGHRLSQVLHRESQSSCRPRSRVSMESRTSLVSVATQTSIMNGLGGKIAGVSARTISQSLQGHEISGNLDVLHTRAQVSEWRKDRMTDLVALVPTMGNLHDGHLELIDEAKKHADHVVVSIFVNPAQFAAHEDFDTYPRTLDQDVERLRSKGVSAVFAPSAKEMYPRGMQGLTAVVPNFVEGKSEAACRPHFFSGVATVCLKLFNICGADVVVFGQKDAMQCSVIKRMLEDFDLDLKTKLVIAPTSREADGLARSSRNSYLTSRMREQAPTIYSALLAATEAAGATPGSVRHAIEDVLSRAGMAVNYVSVADPVNMIEKDDGGLLAGSVVSVACLLRDGNTECRLIDNIIVPTAA